MSLIYNILSVRGRIFLFGEIHQVYVQWFYVTSESTEIAMRRTFKQPTTKLWFSTAELNSVTCCPIRFRENFRNSRSILKSSNSFLSEFLIQCEVASESDKFPVRSICFCYIS